MLNGDIMEYENVGPIVDPIIEDATPVIGDVEMIELFLWFINSVRNYCSVMRLNGGLPDDIEETQLVLRGSGKTVIRIGSEDIHKFFENAKIIVRDTKAVADYTARGARAVARAGKRAYDQIVAYSRPTKRPSNRPQPLVPYKAPDRTVNPIFNNTNMTNTTSTGDVKMSGTEMLAWKNTLTRMYHTYQRYAMSPVKKTVTVPVLGNPKVHHTAIGQGPGLYWTFVSSVTSGSDRDINYGTLTYWDGGMLPAPTTTPTLRNYRLGNSGIIYIFAADWPGTIMNPDPNTHSGGASLILELANFSYNSNTTNKNIPRLWTDVFANTNWNYITVYKTDWVFDFTNYHSYDYCVEIMIFKFAADVDAMDYEKQGLAAFGGAQGGTNAYVNKLPLAYNSDITVVQKKRYIVQGMTRFLAANLATEDEKPNTKRVKITVDRQYVIKRPDLSSYETTLTEKQIWEKYHEDQSGLYFRLMAWPVKLDHYVNTDTGVVTFHANNEGPTPASSIAENTTSNVLACNVYKKSYFKLDENSPAF